MTLHDVTVHRPLPRAGFSQGTAARRIAAVVLVLHGLIHLIGFVVPWRLAQVEGFAYRTTAFGGAIELGESGTAVLGLAWLAVAVAFVLAAVRIWGARARAVPLVGVLSAASLVVCVAGLPETLAGVVVNISILGAVALAVRDRRASHGVDA
jgi:hypothetical protein